MTQRHAEGEQFTAKEGKKWTESETSHLDIEGQKEHAGGIEVSSDRLRNPCERRGKQLIQQRSQGQIPKSEARTFA